MPPLDNSYSVLLDKKFDKSLRDLPEEIRKVFNRKLDYFKDNPYHPSLNTKPYHVNVNKLKELGVDEVYEFYINRKDYRCVFYVLHESREIIIMFVGNHTQIKNKLT